MFSSTMTSPLSEDSAFTAALPSPTSPISLAKHKFIVNKENEDEDHKGKEPILTLKSKLQIDMDKRCDVGKSEFMLGLGLKIGSKNPSEESLLPPTPVLVEPTPVPVESTPVPVESTPVPVESTPVEPRPVEPTPVPIQPTPVPVEPAPALDLERQFPVEDQGQAYFLKPPTVISKDVNLLKDRADKKRKMPINSSDEEADKEISSFFTAENDINAAKKQLLRLNRRLGGFKSASNSDEDPMPIAMKKLEIPLSRMPELKCDGHSSSDTDTYTEAATVEINIQSESGVKAIEPGPGPEAHHRFQETSNTFPIQCAAQLPTSWGSIAIGEWVFARWSDKNYYSGRIVEKGLNDTWKIYYYDQTVAAASEAHILPIKIIGVDTKAVYSPDHMYYPTLAKVVSQKIFKVEELDTVEYTIECASLDRDDEPRIITCNRGQLCLKESEVRVLRKSYQASIRKTADLSEHNILAGSRRRRRVAGNLTKKTLVSKGKDALALITSNHLSGVDRNSHSRRNHVKAVSIVDLTNDDDERENLRSTGLERQQDLESCSGSRMEVDVKPKWNLFKWKRTSVWKPSKAISHGSHNAKEAGTSLFQDFQFFVTASAGGDASKKEDWKEVITSQKGTVLDSVRTMKEFKSKRGEEKVLLISDDYARTEKYIFCLAAGIPCVCHTWLDACLEKNVIVGWEPYELSHGWSLEKECVIKAHGEKPLKNMRIGITASEDTSLYDVFSPVLTAAEALVTLLLLPARNDAIVDADAELDEGFESQSKEEIFIPPDTQVVITDLTCPDDIYGLVLAKKIPIVRAEWVVQSIITGKVAPFNGHVKYEI